MNFFFQIRHVMDEFIKVAGLKMTYLAIRQRLNSNASLSALINAHKIAPEQEAKYLAPPVGK